MVFLGEEDRGYRAKQTIVHRGLAPGPLVFMSTKLTGDCFPGPLVPRSTDAFTEWFIEGNKNTPQNFQHL